MTRKEYQRLVATAVHKGNYKIAMVLQTSCSTGIRVSELKYITVEVVRRGEAKVYCKGKSRTVFLVEQLRSLLVRYIKKIILHPEPFFLDAMEKP